MSFVHRFILAVAVAAVSLYAGFASSATDDVNSRGTRLEFQKATRVFERENSLLLVVSEAINSRQELLSISKEDVYNYLPVLYRGCYYNRVSGMITGDTPDLSQEVASGFKVVKDSFSCAVIDAATVAVIPVGAVLVTWRAKVNSQRPSTPTLQAQQQAAWVQRVRSKANKIFGLAVAAGIAQTAISATYSNQIAYRDSLSSMSRDQLKAEYQQQMLRVQEAYVRLENVMKQMDTDLRIGR